MVNLQTLCTRYDNYPKCDILVRVSVVALELASRTLYRLRLWVSAGYQWDSFLDSSRVVVGLRGAADVWDGQRLLCRLGSEAAKPKVRAGVLHGIKRVLGASGLGCGTLVSEVDNLQWQTIRIHQDFEYQQGVKC